MIKCFEDFKLCFEESKSFVLDARLSCCCVLGGIWVVLFVIHSFLESKANVFLNLFLNKVFFKRSEKQPIVLSNQPVVLVLGVFQKVEIYLSLIDLTTKPNNRLPNQTKQSIVSLKILTELCFDG